MNQAANKKKSSVNGIKLAQKDDEDVEEDKSYGEGHQSSHKPTANANLHSNQELPRGKKEKCLSKPKMMIIALIIIGLSFTLSIMINIGSQSFVPTLGQLDPSIPFNNIPLSQEDQEEVEVYMNRLLKPYDDTNCIFVRFGDQTDGGYVTCLNQINKAKALINFGVEGRDLYGCQVTSINKMLNLQYDCTNKKAPECLTNDNNNRFEYACIGAKTETIDGKRFMSIKDVIDKNNLQGQHIWMKIDIEGGEWQGFKTLPISYLDYIDQIVMEVHVGKRNFPAFAFWGNLDIIENLMEHFVNVNFHVNNYCCFPHNIYPVQCFQVTLINKKIINLNSNRRSFVEHKLNAKNNPKTEKCNTDEKWQQSIQHIDDRYPINRKKIFPLSSEESNENMISVDGEAQSIELLPTLGSSDTNKPFNTTKVKVKDYYAFQSQMEKMLRPFNDTNCKYKRYGESADGAFVICNNFVKQAEALINFRIDGMDEFGCALSKNHHIINLQFDCNNNFVPFCNKQYPHTKFQQICVSNRSFTGDFARKYKSIKDIIDQNNLKRRHIIIKADLEGSQWLGLSTLPLQYLDYIDQIIIELHNSGGKLPDSMWGNLDVVRALMQKFVNVNLHINNWSCYTENNYYTSAPGKHKFKGFAFQVTLVNKKLIKIKSESKSYELNPENKPNGFQYDCQMEN